ncbi:hypothetical protein J5TS2_11850 [Brevibacillus halotolerans]|nr:hypothetical protein J5TS2_11850 [Brevibacillus halotolerans]
MAWDDWGCKVYTIKKKTINLVTSRFILHLYLYVSISTVINVNAILLICRLVYKKTR